MECQVKISYLSDYFQRNSTFDSLIYTGIDMLEWITLYGQLFVYRTIVYRPQITHVKGDTVGTHSDQTEVALVCGH